MTTSNPVASPAIRAGRFYAFSVAFVAAVGGFLFGYDLAIISGAQVYLREQFFLEGASFGFATSSAVLGCMAGPFLGAWLCDKIGRRQTLIFSVPLFGISAILTAIAPDMTTFNIFRIVGGLGVGLCSIASPMYIVEVAPPRIRGGLAIMYQLAIPIGGTMSIIAAWLFAKYLPETLSWRWMFASELLPVIVFLVLLRFVPRSPRWLAEKGHWEEALAVLTRVDGPEYAKEELDEIKESLQEDTGTFSELIQSGMKRALFVGICLALFNNWTGLTAIGTYKPTLLKMGGFPDTVDAIFQSILVAAWEASLTIIVIFLVDRLGRRPLWLVCSTSMIVFMTLFGVIFHYNITGSFVLLMFFLSSMPHAFALGPLPWLMMSEIYPTRIRAKAVAVTTTVLWFAGWSVQFIFPILFGLSQRLVGSIGAAFWLFAGINILAFIFGIKLLPETKGKTLEKIGESWTKC